MSAETIKLKSRFIWQPLLLVGLLAYVFSEIYFLTLLVNSLYYVDNVTDFKQLEITGRIISGAGLGLSVLIALSLNKRLNHAGALKRISFKLITFIMVTIVGYVAMKELYLFMEEKASRQIVHCSIIGNAANRVFSKGTLPEYSAYIASGGQTGYSHKQLIRLYMPLHVCLNDRYRSRLQSSPTIEVELASMVQETGLPGKIARPAVTIYQGFRDNLDVFYPVLAELTTKSPEMITQFRQAKRIEFTQFLDTQSRFTQHDIVQLDRVYGCALNRLNPPVAGVLEQQFLISVSSCLNEIARERFHTLPATQQAADIFKLEQNIALHWARQFINSPENTPEEAFNLMRKSFALVFLPTYAVMVSTFIIFICLAAYIRTRFLIRAEKLNKRINPFINACLSPLVVVPFIWTAIFLCMPRPDVEKTLFPAQTQSNWVRFLQVTQRPLFYYYDWSLASFIKLKVPVILGSNIIVEQRKLSTEYQLQPAEFSGYYDARFCQDNCESLRLLLSPDSRPASVFYRLQQCRTRLIFDSVQQNEWLIFYERSDKKAACRFSRKWRIKPRGEVLEIQIQEENKQVLTIQAQNLFI